MKWGEGWTRIHRRMVDPVRVEFGSTVATSSDTTDIYRLAFHDPTMLHHIDDLSSSFVLNHFYHTMYSSRALLTILALFCLLSLLAPLAAKHFHPEPHTPVAPNECVRLSFKGATLVARPKVGAVPFL